MRFPFDYCQELKFQNDFNTNHQSLTWLCWRSKWMCNHKLNWLNFVVFDLISLKAIIKTIRLKLQTPMGNISRQVRRKPFLSLSSFQAPCHCPKCERNMNFWSSPTTSGKACKKIFFPDIQMESKSSNQMAWILCYCENRFCPSARHKSVWKFQ